MQTGSVFAFTRADCDAGLVMVEEDGVFGVAAEAEAVVDKSTAVVTTVWLKDVNVEEDCDMMIGKEVVKVVRTEVAP